MSFPLIPEGEDPSLLPRSIREQDYPLLFKLDRAVYPTKVPVTADVVDGWYKRNREFGMVFPGEYPDSISGLFVIIPLSTLGWDKLTSGKLTEAQMRDEMIFDPQTDTSLGLHSYHIENLTKKKGFSQRALLALGKIVKVLPPQVKLLGFSSYAASAAGAGLRENESYNMHETGYISTEYVIIENGQMRVSNLSSEEVKTLTVAGAELRRCKMLITTPDEKSIVWEYLKK